MGVILWFELVVFWMGGVGCRITGGRFGLVELWEES